MRDRNQTQLTDTISEEKFIVRQVSKEFTVFENASKFRETVYNNLAEESVISTFDDGSFLFTLNDGTMFVGRIGKVYEVLE